MRVLVRGFVFACFYLTVFFEFSLGFEFRCLFFVWFGTLVVLFLVFIVFSFFFGYSRRLKINWLFFFRIYFYFFEWWVLGLRFSGGFGSVVSVWLEFLGFCGVIIFFSFLVCGYWACLFVLFLFYLLI